jgi:hypothetical protein
VNRQFASLALAGAATLLAGCQLDWVRDHPLGCRADEQALTRDVLYFGRSIPGGGEVDEAAWQRFEHDVLSPAFARGYTVLDAHGRWQDASGATIGEASRVVVLVHGDDLESAKAVRDVVARYKTMFRQESVLRERGVVCAAF